MNLFDSNNNLDIRDYFLILRRRKWYFIVPFVLAAAAGMYKITSNVPIYESRCIIQIKASTLQLLPTSIKETLPRVSEPATAFAVKRQILSSEYLQQVIDKLDLRNHPDVVALAERGAASFPDKDIEEIKEIFAIRLLKASVKVINRTPTIIMLKADSRSPDEAYDIVKTLSDIYIADSYRRSMSRVHGARSFNNEQIAVFKKRLEDAEHALESFRRSQITTKLMDESVGGGELTRIHNALVSVEITIKEKQDYLEYLQKQLTGEGAPSALPDSPVLQENMDHIDERIGEMAALMKRFSWKSPEVINVNRKINDLREEIRVSLEDFLAKQYAGVNLAERNLMLEQLISLIDLEILRKKRDAYNGLIASFKEARSQRPAQEMKLAKLRAEVKLNRRIYNTFLQQNEGVQIEEMISEADASDRFKVLEVPRRPLQPINAGSNMILLVTAVAALGLGSGAVYSREFLDSSFRTVNEAEEFLQLPVLGVLPRLGAVPDTPSPTRRFLIVWFFALITLVAAAFIYFRMTFGEY